MTCEDHVNWIKRRIAHYRTEISTYKSAIAAGAMSSITNLVGNLMPFLLTVLYYSVATKNQPTGIHYKDGQFYIYAAALLTSAGFIFFDFKKKVYDRYAIFCGISCALLIVASLVYAWQLAGTDIEPLTILNSSVGIFIVSALLFFYANLINQAKIDVKQVDRDNVKTLMEEMPNG
jgi:cytochrome c biogenesis factor